MLKRNIKAQNRKQKRDQIKHLQRSSSKELSESLVKGLHMSTTTTTTEQLFVSQLFLLNKGGGSSFTGRDDFQKTLSALQA